MLHEPRPARLHYGWVILAVTGLSVLMAAGVTAVPAVLIHPLEAAGLALTIRQRPGGVPVAVGLPAPTPASR